MIKKKNKVWLGFTAILFFMACSPEKQPNVVAEIGTKVVTVSELKDIVTFNAYPNLPQNPSLLKKTVLYALIAEKLLAQEAPEIVGNLADIKQEIAQYKNEAVIEKFWDAEIFSKIKISETELKEAYFKSKEKRIVKFAKFATRREAQQFSALLKSGQSFQKAARAIGRPESFVPVDTIQFGSGLPHIEKNVFALKTGESGAPVKEGRWYFVFQLSFVKKDLFTAEDDFEYMRPELTKRLRKNKTVLSYEAYEKEKLRPYVYRLDSKAFKALAVEMDKHLFSDGASLQKKEDTETRKPLPTLKNRRLLHRTAVTFADGSRWSVATLFKNMAHSPYFIDTKTRGAFRKSLIVSAKHVLDDAVLLKRSLDLGLDKTEYVKAQSHLWSDYLLSLEAAKKLEHKGGEGEVQTQLDSFLIKKAPDYKIKIYRTVLDTLNIEPTNMIVLKEHFPGRTIAPSLQPFFNLSRWTAYLNKTE